MKNLLLLSFAALLFFSSCNKKKNCYICITTTSNNYVVQRTDTTMQCSFTAKDAKAYEVSNTVNGPMGDPTPGETKATSCHIPTK